MTLGSYSLFVLITKYNVKLATLSREKKGSHTTWIGILFAFFLRYGITTSGERTDGAGRGGGGWDCSREEVCYVFLAIPRAAREKVMSAVVGLAQSR